MLARVPLQRPGGAGIVAHGAGHSASLSVSVYLGSPMLRARALSRFKIDEYVPQNQHFNLRIVGQHEWGSSQFENNYFTEMFSGSEAGSYLRLIDFVYHSTLGSRVIKQKKKKKYPASAKSPMVTANIV